MRTSRDWIERTIDELAAPPAPADLQRVGEGRARQAAADRCTFEITLSDAELDALDEMCRLDELSPKQALSHIVRARLLGQPQFGRGDRARLRACLELLRAIEQHIGRAARPAAALDRTALGREVLIQELLELGAYVRRVGRALGDAMQGNLHYWRGERTDSAAE